MSNPIHDSADTGPPLSDDLALTAWRFAAGELPAEQAEQFAEQLANDQSARDALADAIRLSAAALGQPAPAPSDDPLRAEAVREAVRGGWLGWVFPRRPYRGHPLAWAGLGGAAAAGLTAFAVWLADPPVNPPEPIGSPRISERPADNPVQRQLAVQPIELAPRPRTAETTVASSQDELTTSESLAQDEPTIPTETDPRTLNLQEPLGATEDPARNDLRATEGSDSETGR